MNHGTAWCATACVLAFFVQPASVSRAQTVSEAMPKEDLQLLASATGRIKTDYVRDVSEVALTTSCAAAAAAAAGVNPAPRPAGAADLASIPDLLMEVKSSATAGTTHRKIVVACIEGMVGQLDRHSALNGPEEARELPKSSGKEPETVKREVIRLPDAEFAWLEPSILHIRITRFRQDARRNLLREMEKFIGGSERVPGALLLDLRGNAGGGLYDTLEVAGLFLDDGAPIGSVRGRALSGGVEFKANVGLRNAYQPELPETVLRALREAPMLVVVNGRTASGAEMVAGALQANGRARLIGLPTFGSGSIQKMYRLNDDTTLKLTFGIWYTPKDRPLEDDPLLPDLPIEAVPAGTEADGLDRSLAEAVRYLSPGRGVPDGKTRLMRRD
jgi:hypothetical protein